MFKNAVKVCARCGGSGVDRFLNQPCAACADRDLEPAAGELCGDCKGSGRYVGLAVEEACAACEGSGRVVKAAGEVFAMPPAERIYLNGSNFQPGRVAKGTVCPECAGAGMVPDGPNSILYMLCNTCSGRGMV